jgi:hypothetical protein
MSGWDFVGPIGCHFFQVDLQKKRDPSNIVHNGPCRISTRFFIEGHLLGPKPQMTLV